MEMGIQKAGDNSTQVQTSVINVYNGISEERAREIYKEEFGKIIELTQEAEQTAVQRVCELENRVISKLSQIDKGLDFFSNPDFQFLLIEAQKAAARSERPVDYDLLSELLIHRVKNDTDREKRLGVKKAVEIVDAISDEALLGLTVIHSVSCFTPITGNLNSGLDVLENLFNTIIYDQLPEGDHWLDHLDLLGAIRVYPMSKLMPMMDYYSSVLDGYICVGIPKESGDHNKAIDLLASINLSNNILVDNELNPGYVRLCIPQQNSFDLVKKIISPTMMVPLSAQEIAVLKEIISLYNNDKNLIQKTKQNFLEKWNERKSLKILKEWWEKIPYSVTTTEVGKVLAHANAQRCDNSLPSLN